MISDGRLRGLGLSSQTVLLTGPAIRALLALLVIGVVILQLVTCARIARATVAKREMADFRVLFQSSQRALDGNAYEVTPGAPGGFMWTANLNPPHVVLLLVPLTVFSITGAFTIWICLSAASAGWALWLIFRELRLRLTPVALLWTAFSLLCAAPTGALLFSAQISWCLWGPVTYLWVAARRNRLTSAAIVLGVLMSIKPFLGLLMLFFALNRRWSQLLLTVAITAGCFLLGIAVLGWASFIAWWSAAGSVTWAGHVFNASWFGFLERLIARPAPVWQLTPIATLPGLVWPIWLVASAGVLGISWAALKREKPGSVVAEPLRTLETDRVLAVASSAGFLISPLSWIYYLFFLTGPFLSLCLDEGWRTSLRWRRLVLAAAVVCLALPPGILVVGQPNGAMTILVGSAYFWALLALWICALQPLQPAGPPTALSTSAPHPPQTAPHALRSPAR